jgi:hypothetical protein
MKEHTRPRVANARGTPQERPQKHVIRQSVCDLTCGAHCGQQLRPELCGARSVLQVSGEALWRKPSLNQGFRKQSRKLGRATNAFELLAYTKRRLQFEDASDRCSRFI